MGLGEIVLVLVYVLGVSYQKRIKEMILEENQTFRCISLQGK